MKNTVFMGMLLFTLESRANLAACDQMFLISSLEMFSPDMNIIPQKSRALNSGERYQTLEFIKANPSIDSNFFYDGFMTLQKEFPQLSLDTTLGLIAHANQHSLSLTSIAVDMKKYNAKVAEAFAGTPKSPIGVKPHYGTNAAVLKELGIFFYEKSLTNSKITPDFAKMYSRVAMELGVKDWEDISRSLDVMLEQRLPAEDVIAIHNELDFKTKAMGYAVNEHHSRADFLESVLLSVYQKGTGKSMQEMQSEVNEILSSNTGINSPQLTINEMMNRLAKKEEQQALLLQMRSLFEEAKQKAQAEKARDLDPSI